MLNLLNSLSYLNPGQDNSVEMHTLEYLGLFKKFAVGSLGPKTLIFFVILRQKLYIALSKLKNKEKGITLKELESSVLTQKECL